MLSSGILILQLSIHIAEVSLNTLFGIFFQFGGMIHLGRHFKLCILYEFLKMLEVLHGPKNLFLSTDGGSRSKGEHFPYEQEIKFFAKVQYMTCLVSASVCVCVCLQNGLIRSSLLFIIHLSINAPLTVTIYSLAQKYLLGSCEMGLFVVFLVSTYLTLTQLSPLCLSHDLVMPQPPPPKNPSSNS